MQDLTLIADKVNVERARNEKRLIRDLIVALTTTELFKEKLLANANKGFYSITLASTIPHSEYTVLRRYLGEYETFVRTVFNKQLKKYGAEFDSKTLQIYW